MHTRVIITGIALMVSCLGSYTESAESESMLALIQKIQVDDEGIYGAVDGCEFSSDGVYIFATDNHANGKKYVAATGELLGVVDHFTMSNTTASSDGELNAVGFSPDGSLLFTGRNDDGCKIWDASTFALLQHFGDGFETDGADFSPNGVWFAYSHGPATRVLNVADWSIAANKVHPKAINSCDFSYDSGFLAAADSSGRLRVYATTNWNQTHEELFPASIKSCRFSPDASLLVAAGRSKTGKVFAVSPNGTLTKVHEWEEFGNTTAYPWDDQDSNPAIEAVAWSNDGRFLFTGGLNTGEVRVWRASDWTMVETFQGQEGLRQVEYLDVSIDNQVIAGGHEGNVHHFQFSPPPILPESVFEAEDAQLNGVAVVNASNASGGQVVDYPASGGSVTWTVPIAQAGRYQLAFRYALSSGNRPLRLLVDGVEIDASIDFPASGDWGTFREIIVSECQWSVGNHSVTLDATDLKGANIDCLHVRDITPRDTRSVGLSSIAGYRWELAGELGVILGDQDVFSWLDASNDHVFMPVPSGGG